LIREQTIYYFDFTVDKAAKTVLIKREFDADLSLVWDAFTKAELIDQWIAPKPYTAKTKYQDFKVGGKRFYAMISPEGQERWAIQNTLPLTPKTNFKMYNAFADENKTLNCRALNGIILSANKMKQQQ
jgi:uncharacterized protein YndB with AHSA1/START domain